MYNPIWQWLVAFVAASPLIYNRLLTYYIKRVEMLWKAGDRDDAVKLLERVLLCSVFHVHRLKLSLRYSLACRYYILKRSDDCGRACRAALNLHPKPVQELHLRRMMSEQLAHLGFPKEAAEERRRALERFPGTPDNIVSIQDLGKILLDERQYAQSYVMYEQGLALIPDKNSDSYRTLINYLAVTALKAERQHDALRWAEEMLARGVQNDARFVAQKIIHESILILGSQLKKEMRYAEAEALYQKGLSLMPDDMALRQAFLINLSLVSQMLGRSDQMLRWSRLAIEGGATGIELSNAYVMAGLAFMAIGDYDQATSYTIKAYELALSAGNMPNAADTCGVLARIEFRQGHLPEALAKAQQAIEIAPGNSATGYITKATCLLEQGNYHEALETYRQMYEATIEHMQDKPLSDFLLNFGMAQTLTKLKQYEAALLQIQKNELVIPPEIKIALWAKSLKAIIFAKRGMHAEALELVPQIEAKIADFEQDQDTRSKSLSAIAHVYFETGNFAQSLVYWQRIFSEDSSPITRPKLFYYLGECQWRLGNQEAARDSWRQAVALNIDTVATRKAQSRLTECS